MCMATVGEAGGKRARTRARLMAAALEVADERGFEAASLEEIATSAGMTKGAIYSNFAGKADLMASAIEDRALHLAPAYQPGAPLEAQMQAVADALIKLLPEATGLERLNAAYQVYAAAQPELRARTAEIYRRELDRLTDLLIAAYGERLAVSPRAFVVAIQSLVLGFVHQHRLTPEEVTPAVIRSAFAALTKGAVKA